MFMNTGDIYLFIRIWFILTILQKKIALIKTYVRITIIFLI